jgi:hypothetical protein
MAHGAEHGGHGGGERNASHGGGKESMVGKFAKGMADLFWETGGGALSEAITEEPKNILTLGKKGKGGGGAHH